MAQNMLLNVSKKTTQKSSCNGREKEGWGGGREPGNELYRLSLEVSILIQVRSRPPSHPINKQKKKDI